MNSTSELTVILGNFLNWNKARLDCFAKMLLALFTVRTVNLREIALAFDSDAELDSRYKRIKRFFASFKIDLTVIARWLFQLFFSSDDRFYLTLDRTNWFWGKQSINVLVLGITYEGMSIPIFWSLLPGCGNSETSMRIDILQRFIDTFGKAQIEGLLCDREFIGKEWFAWLVTEEIPFYIRIKSNNKVSVLSGKHWPLARLFHDLNNKQQRIYENHVTILKQRLRVVASRSEKGELMIIVTNSDPKNAIAIYLRRWEIENLFQGLKGRGFRFESTHMTNHQRIEKLMILLAVGFCWAHKVGEWRAEVKPIPMNKHQENRRPQYSYFRYGLDYIRENLLHLSRKASEFQQCLLKLAHISDALGEGG